MHGEMKRAIERICRDLHLPAGDAYTQDWAYELPDAFRSYESLLGYLEAYSARGYGDTEKRLLMQLMLDITNDLLQSDAVRGYEAWSRLAELLKAETELHHDQIEYWALPGEPLEDAFRLTPLVRRLRETLMMHQATPGS